MPSAFTFFSALRAWMRGARVSRDAEILFLRQQLLVLRRSAPARLRLTNTDRLIFVWLYRLFPPPARYRSHLQAGDAGAVAPRRLSPVLALEVTVTTLALIIG